ncbi:MAG: DUF1302 family protein [Pseudomonadota bacterium]
MKGKLHNLFWTVALCVLVAIPAQARISFEALGGDVEIEGFLSSEARARVGSGESYLTQWLQRLQVEATIQYEEVGIFDELSFTTIIRPEFDVGYYENIGGRGRGSSRTSYLGDPFSFNTDPVGHGGFDFAFGGEDVLSTGGVGKIVTHGLQNPAWLAENFEVILNRTPNGAKFSTEAFFSGGDPGFPVVATKNQLELNCKRCLNVDNSHLEVAMANTDSQNLYPFRELYADAIIGDWWIRLGKQQIVWGKTDFFRLQDVLNPVDFGQHFFFDSFEDIRIPQWMLSIQYKAGAIGPLTDNAFQFVWNFDEFRPVGLGNPSHPWGHPFAKDKSVFALFNEFFTVEPCIGPRYAPQTGDYATTGIGLTNAAVNAAIAANPWARCGAFGPLDDRKPSGFGQVAGLSLEDRPEWDIKNTEPAVRWEFRFKAVRMALSHHFGWQDIPVFRFHTVNASAGLTGLPCNDRLIFDLAADLATGGGSGAPGACGAGFGGIPVVAMDPGAAINAFAASPTASGTAVRAPDGSVSDLQAEAQRALREDNAELFWRHSGNFAVFGGQTEIKYKQSHTTGLSIDYFEPWSGIVFRVESSITLDELVNNTRKADWVDESDVMRWSIGLDRPTFIPFLNKDRTFFLSMQIFDTWYIDHEGDKNTGFLNDEHNFITTFFFIGNYLRDTVKPIGFLVWEEQSNAWTAGLNVEWLMDNHWSVKLGMHTLWGGTNNFTHDTGPFTSFIPGNLGTGTVAFPASTYNQASLGVAGEGIGALRDNDEVFLQLKYQF